MSVQPDSETEKRSNEFMELMKSLGNEFDRGMVITTAAVLDFYLERVIRAFLVNSSEVKDLFEGPYAPFGNLSGKIKAAHLMGLISKEESERINAVRKVRNVFAHEIAASFNHPHVVALCSKAPIYDGKNADRDAFLHMAINTGVELIYRDMDILTKHKRKPFKRNELTSVLAPSDED